MGLKGIILRLVWRLRVVVFARWLSVCLLWAIAVAIVVAGVDKLVYLGVSASVIAVIAVAAALPAALVVSILRERIGRLRAALEADRALHLGDRLASALQLARGDGPWADAIARDAEARSRQARPSAVFPFLPALSARLLVPAAIVFALVWVLPPADLLGRMEREAEERVAAEAEAERGRTAVAAAVRQLPPGALGSSGPEDRDNGPGALRVALIKIEGDVRTKRIGEKERLDLSEQLRRLADLMEGEGGAKLNEAIKMAADALAKGDRDAANLLRAAQEELARLEKAWKDSQSTNAYVQKLMDKKRAELRSVSVSESAPGRQPKTVEGSDEGLAELVARSRSGPGSADTSAGIIYSPRSTPGASVETYEEAVRSANALIESGAIPPGYVRLVRNYFDSIKPVGQ